MSDAMARAMARVWILCRAEARPTVSLWQYNYADHNYIVWATCPERGAEDPVPSHGWHRLTLQWLHKGPLEDEVKVVVVEQREPI